MNEELNNIIDDILKEKLKLHYENEELEAQGKLIKELCKEIERLNDVKNDLLYVLEQLDGYLDKGWTIDLNFTDIREKYKKDIKEYENWK